MEPAGTRGVPGLWARRAAAGVRPDRLGRGAVGADRSCPAACPAHRCAREFRRRCDRGGGETPLCGVRERPGVALHRFARNGHQPGRPLCGSRHLRHPARARPRDHQYRRAGALLFRSRGCARSGAGHGDPRDRAHRRTADQPRRHADFAGRLARRAPRSRLELPAGEFRGAGRQAGAVLPELFPVQPDDELHRRRARRRARKFRAGAGNLGRPVGGSALLRAHHDGRGFFRAAIAGAWTNG